MNPPGYPPQQGAPPPGYAPPGYPPPGYPPQGYGYPPGPPQPPQKKGMSGCLIAALVVGGLGLLFIIGIVVFIVVIAKKAVDIAKEGINAPGAAEIRAAGCDVGVVTDMAKFGSTFGFDAGAAGGSTPTAIVVCQVAANKAAPSCQDIAGVYVNAVQPAGQFTVLVQTQGTSVSQCQGLYSPKGALVQKLK